MHNVHRFTWAEFLDEVQRPPRYDGGLQASTEETSKSYRAWAGGSIEQARALAQDGWPEGVARLEGILARIEPRIAQAIERIDWYNDVEASGQLDVAAYLENQPECWFTPQTEIIASQGKLIHIVIHGVYSSSRTQEQIWTNGAAVAAAVHAFELAGNSVKVTWGQVSYDAHHRQGGPGHSTSACFVTVKDYGEPLNMARLVFIVAHPAMCRNLWFRVVERYDEAERRRHDFHNGGGYGPLAPLSASPERERGDIDIDHQFLLDSKPEQIIRWVEEQLVKQGVHLTK